MGAIELSRRQMIGSGAAAASLALLPRRGGATALQGPEINLAPVVERVRAFAEADLASKGLPGMQIALVAPGRASATLGVGLADLDGRVAATPDQLFQIGSISKSITVMALFGLVERGRLDLNANVQDLLPEVPLPAEPITVAQLIEHSSGLPNTVGESLFPRVPGGRFWTGFPPGSRYSYCNTGYLLLGHIVARTSGLPFDVTLSALVLEPLGMTSARPVIRLADRPAFATGHSRLREDIPWLPHAPLTEARWMDFTNAAGSVAATAADMVRYLEFTLKLGRGQGAPLFSDSLAERFRSSTIDRDTPGERYGHGLVHTSVDDRPVLRHTGGMIGFSSAFTADPAAGVAVYASVNVGGAGGYRPIELNNYALALLRAAAAGQDLPEPRTPAALRAVPEAIARQLVGRWLSGDRLEFTIAERSGALFISSEDTERPLMVNDKAFVTDHPSLPPYAIAPYEGSEDLLRVGGHLFARGRAGPMPPVPQPVAALAGAYFAPEAWSSYARVFALGADIVIGSNLLRQAADGSWRFADPALAPERVWFEDLAGGRPQTMNVSGVRFTRQLMT